MDNQTRRILLERVKASGFPGSILDVFQNPAILDEYVAQQQQQQQPIVAQTPQEQEQGLGPAHAAGNFNQSMIFPNVQPGQSFNTMETKVPINIEKVDDQGNLVESYKAVPPGIQNFPTGPNRGMVIESPAEGYQKGGFHQRIYTDPIEFAEANKAYNDSLSAYNAYPIPSGLTAYNMSREEFLRDNNPAPGQIIHFHNIKNRDFANSTRINPARIEPVGDSSLGTAGFEWVYKRPTEEPVYREKLNLQTIPYKGLSINSNPTSLGDMTSIINSSPLNYKYQLQPGVYGNQIRVGVYQDGKYQPFSRERIQNEIEENRIPDQREENYLRIQKLKGYQTGGVRKYQTGRFKYQAGSEAAADATAVKVNPLVRAINIDKAPSNFDYQNYYDKANKYLSRDIFKGTTLTAKDIADAANEFYTESNYQYPLDLLLTQAQIESKLGKALKSKHNYFNVGNTDSGATRDFPSAKDSVKDYMTLMYNNYLNKGQKNVEELLKPKGFVNYEGSRYASNPDYENMLSSQMQFINNYLKNHKTGGVRTYLKGGLKNRVLYNKAKYKR